MQTACQHRIRPFIGRGRPFVAGGCRITSVGCPDLSPARPRTVTLCRDWSAACNIRAWPPARRPTVPRRRDASPRRAREVSPSPAGACVRTPAWVTWDPFRPGEGANAIERNFQKGIPIFSRGWEYVITDRQHYPITQPAFPRPPLSPAIPSDTIPPNGRELLPRSPGRTDGCPERADTEV